MMFIKTDPFGNILFIKRCLIGILGIITYRRYNGFNQLQIEGSEIIRELPDQNILFISNHQTYFADVAAMFHVFNASLRGRVNTIKNMGYLWTPKLNMYYIAARETMRSGILPKILAYVGAVSVDRTWRKDGKPIQRAFNHKDTERIGMALEDGWVVTFPQGTTKPWKPIRKGTAHIIKQYRPLVVPIVIDGFRRSFDKKGLRIKKKDILQSMVIKYPLDIDYEKDTVEIILDKIGHAIEQHPSYLKVIPEDEIEELEKTDKKRRWRY